MVQLHAVVLILGGISGTGLEEIVVGLDIGRHVDNFTGLQLTGSIQHDWMTMMICALEMTGESDIADIFATFCGVSRGDLVFREDGGKWAFRNASPTVNARIRIDIDPGPLVQREARDHTFHGANIDTTAIPHA